MSEHSLYPKIALPTLGIDIHSSWRHPLLVSSFKDQGVTSTEKNGSARCCFDYPVLPRAPFYSPGPPNVYPPPLRHVLCFLAFSFPIIRWYS